MKQISEKCYNPEVEILTDSERYNELVMTSLRTQWGFDLNLIENEDFRLHFLENVTQYIDSQMVVFDGTRYVITDKGRFMADGIASDLFV